VDLSIILPGVAMTLGVVGFLTWKTLQIRRAPVRTGASSLVGKTARVVRVADEPGGAWTVLVDGEYWDAYGAAGAPAGEMVRIQAVEGLKLRVERRT
jgi:membrane protein implicated in regulation of membrane protease activity